MHWEYTPIWLEKESSINREKNKFHHFFHHGANNVCAIFFFDVDGSEFMDLSSDVFGFRCV